MVGGKEGDSDRTQGTKSSLTPLYLARTLAAWGDRTWQFVGGMFMLQLGDTDSSLQIVGIYGLVSCLGLLICGSAIGRLVDSTPRDRWLVSSIISLHYICNLPSELPQEVESMNTFFLQKCSIFTQLLVYAPFAFRLITCAVFTQNISIVFSCVIMAIHFSVSVNSINYWYWKSVFILHSSKWLSAVFGIWYSWGFLTLIKFGPSRYD